MLLIKNDKGTIQLVAERILSCNHSKYHYLFDMWIGNITQDQIEGFSKQMYNKENHVLWIQ